MEEIWAIDRAPGRGYKSSFIQTRTEAVDDYDMEMKARASKWIRLSERNSRTASSGMIGAQSALLADPPPLPNAWTLRRNEFHVFVWAIIVNEWLASKCSCVCRWESTNTSWHRYGPIQLFSQCTCLDIDHWSDALFELFWVRFISY